MINWTYTRTNSMGEQLQHIDSLRMKLMSVPIPLHTEQIKVWESLIERLYFSLSLYDLSITKRSLYELLLKGFTSKTSLPSNTIIAYKDAYQQIYYNWYAIQKEILFDDIADIYETAYSTKINRLQSSFDDGLRYIQQSQEHPLIQAALAQLIMYNEKPFPAYNEEFSHLVFYMFLTKYGWDCRRLVIIEKSYYHERSYFKTLIQNSYNEHNATSWLEFVVQHFDEQLRKSTEELFFTNEEFSGIADVTMLNDRQKVILALLDDPNKKITNAFVQKHCKISAITAARDLAKLTSLGFIKLEGKGRGVAYSRN